MTMIKETIRTLGVPATYAGFHQLCRCVWIAVENEKSMAHLQSGIYGIVGAESNTNRKNIARNLSTYIEYLWNRGNRKRLNEIAGCEMDEKPRAGELISILAAYVARKHSGTR